MPTDNQLSFLTLLTDPLMVVDAGGALVDLNRACAMVFGRTREEMVGRQLSDLFVNSTEEITAYLRKCTQVRNPIHGSMSLIDSDGLKVRYQCKGGLLQIGTGESLALLLLRLDVEQSSIHGFFALNEKVKQLKQQIGERMTIECQLRESEAQARAVLETAVDAFITIDVRGIIESFNLAAEKMFGYTSEEVIGTNISRLMPFPHQEKHDEYLAAYIETGRKKIIGIGREVEAVRKNGTKFPISLSVGEVKLGNRHTFTGVVRDISDQRRAEKLRREADELYVSHLQAQKANAAKSEFLANMSHEIRTPMTAILGYTDILLERATDQEEIEAAITIKRNGEHLLKIINDVLDLSKIDAGKLQVESIPCAPTKIVEEVVSLMQVKVDAQGLTLDVEYDGPIPETIASDPTRLRQILINLIGNAVKFTESGTVRLAVRLTDSQTDEPKLQIDIIDTGIGMNDEQVVQLFMPFTQADSSTTRRFGGTGLGLTISRRLARTLGGDIVPFCSIGGGCTFRLTIPTGPLNGVAMLTNRAESHQNSDHKSTSPKRTTPKLDCRILLAEDGPDNQRLVSVILRKAGAEVDVAENGQIAYDEALAAQAASNPYSVILMDMQMPVLDGYDATRNLREAGYSRPIIALTAHAMTGDREKCIAAGCDDFATKPIDRQALIAMIADYSADQATGCGLQTNGVTQ